MPLRKRNSAFTGSALALSSLIFIQVMTSAMTTQRKVRMCYFTSWAQYRFGAGRFLPSDIEPSMCTHILYAFARVDLDTNSPKTIEQNDLYFYSQIVALKKDDPDLRFLLSLGGGSAGTAEKFEVVANDTTRTGEFTKNTVSYLRQFNFDGLDVDWEFPNQESRTFFQQFIRLLGVEFSLEAARTGREKLLLTIDVAPHPSSVALNYGPSEFLPYVDYVNLMAYDMWGTWSSTLGHHSPLHVVIPYHPEQGRFSVHKLVQEWIRQGTPKEKLVLGMATYGVTGVMSSAALHSPGDPWARHMGTAGPLTRMIGILSYYEICSKLQTGEWQTAYSTAGDVPYAWNEAKLQYISYDDQRSFAAKAQYILNEGLAGAMFWTIAFDDFKGLHCQAGAYPLLGKVKDILERNFTGGQVTDAEVFTTTTISITSTPTTASASPQVTTTSMTATEESTSRTTTTTATTNSGFLERETSSACPVFRCSSLFGLYPDPADCSRFYQCVFANPVNRECPPTLMYDATAGMCNWPALARCRSVC